MRKRKRKGKEDMLIKLGGDKLMLILEGLLVV
jgi:hypothetical protein